MYLYPPLKTQEGVGKTGNSVCHVYLNKLRGNIHRMTIKCMSSVAITAPSFARYRLVTLSSIPDNVPSALEVIFNVMRSINPRFTY